MSLLSATALTSGKAGAKNAAVLACRILALEDEKLSGRLDSFKKKMVEEVNEKARKITL